MSIDAAVGPRSAGGHPAGHSSTGLSHAVLGTLAFIGMEAMFFAGLISAFLVLRSNAPVWPPPDQPQLPVGVTAVNTVVLLLSGWTMWQAARTTGRIQWRWLAVTAVLGAAFLAVQGSEWLRLLGYGLRASTCLYGATFYTLIGAHGLHVLGALLVLLSVLHRGATAPLRVSTLDGCLLYWLFVVAVWPVLYGLVYVS